MLLGFSSDRLRQIWGLIYGRGRGWGGSRNLWLLVGVEGKVEAESDLGALSSQIEGQTKAMGGVRLYSEIPSPWVRTPRSRTGVTGIRKLRTLMIGLTIGYWNMLKVESGSGVVETFWCYAEYFIPWLQSSKTSTKSTTQNKTHDCYFYPTKLDAKFK